MLDLTLILKALEWYLHNKVRKNKKMSSQEKMKVFEEKLENLTKFEKILDFFS